MSIIERYIFRRIAVLALAALVMTTAMALTTQVMNRVDFLTSSGQTLKTMGLLALFLVPPMIVIAMPFALLIGVLNTLRTMNQNAELAVLEASGASVFGRMRPALALAAMATAAAVLLSVWIEPAASRQIRELIARAAGDLLSAAIQSGGFRQIEEGLVIQIAEKRTGGAFGGIFVHDARDPESHITYVADSGMLINEQGRTLMLVRNGEIQRKNTADNAITVIRFDAYSLDASTFSAPQAARIGPKQQTTAYLLDPAPDDPLFQSRPDLYASEVHRRFSEPLYPLMMVVIALYYSVRARSNRRETLTAVVMAGTICFAARAAGFAVAPASGSSTAALIATYGIPLGMTALFALMILRGGAGTAGLAFAERAAASASARFEALARRLRLRGRAA